MTCPDLTDLARAGTSRADPSVVEHILNCPSCWLDWQIQESARRSTDIGIDAESREDADGFQRRVMARIAALERDSDGPVTLSQMALSAVLVAVAVVAFALVRVQVTSPGVLGGVAIYAIGLGVAWAWYGRGRDKKLDLDQAQ